MTLLFNFNTEVWLIRDSAFNSEGASTLTKLDPGSVGKLRH